jgi:hypothetical protein
VILLAFSGLTPTGSMVRRLELLRFFFLFVRFRMGWPGQGRYVQKHVLCTIPRRFEPGDLGITYVSELIGINGMGNFDAGEY